MTNYERIKAMTVEQMAHFMDNDRCDCCVYKDELCDEIPCINGHLQWLNKEVSDGAD